jgi:phage terminase small subunit
MLLKTKTGYVQQSPWLSIANRQMELMGRYMGELGLTPASRSRIASIQTPESDPVTRIEFVTVYQDKDGELRSGPSEGGFALEARPMTDETGVANWIVVRDTIVG